MSSRSSGSDGFTPATTTGPTMSPFGCMWPERKCAPCARASRRSAARRSRGSGSECHQRTSGQRLCQPPLKFGRRRPRHEHAPRSNAGLTGIEPESENERPHRQLQMASARMMTASQPESSIADGMASGASWARIFEPVDAEPVKKTLSTPARMAAWAASGSSGKTRNSAAGSPAALSNRTSSRAAPVPRDGLEQNSVAGHERLQYLYAGQK